MSNAREQVHPGTSRRTLLKRIALGFAAMGAYAVLSRRPLGGIKRRGRSIPAELPGKGSIFQPRDDRRAGHP